MPDTQRKARISIAGPGDRPAIYAMRHEVYARELGQHKINPEQKLADPLEPFAGLRSERENISSRWAERTC
jgi:hypothetical protein